MTNDHLMTLRVHYYLGIELVIANARFPNYTKKIQKKNLTKKKLRHKQLQIAEQNNEQRRIQEESRTRINTA